MTKWEEPPKHPASARSDSPSKCSNQSQQAVAQVASNRDEAVQAQH